MISKTPRHACDTGYVCATAAGLLSRHKPGEVFDPQTKFPGSTVLILASAVDYSLQMQTGLEHLCDAASKGEKPFDTEPAPVVCMPWDTHDDATAIWALRRCSSEARTRKCRLDGVRRPDPLKRTGGKTKRSNALTWLKGLSCVLDRVMWRFGRYNVCLGSV